MVDYRLDQSGQEVQDILNGAAMQVDLTAENERATEAEQTLQGNINDEETRAKGVEGTLQDNIDAEEARAKAAEKQNADDIDALEAVVPTGASSENKLATESFVNDSVATATATFRGTYNLVSDLHLTLEATHTNIANALATAVTTANNNDFVFVQIPTSEETPTVIGSIERYKYNGFSWSYEYTLNNSGFTQAQWDAVNSGITGGDVAKLRALPTNTELTTLLNGLQGDIDAEEGRAKAAELNLQGAIDAEEVRAKAAEKANADDIDALEAVIPAAASSENKVATASDVSSLSAAIEAILLLIPSAASSVNQLADKAFVNSSIATNTGIFRGTYNLVSDLHLTLASTHAQIGNALALAILEANNNDYAFVQIPTVATAPTEIAQTDRYKWNGSTWEYEYTLNNSGFTSAQWTAINSGITSALVSKLSALPTNSELTSEIGTLVSAINAINQKIPSSASLANKLVDTAALESSIIQVLGVLTVSYNITSTDGHFSFHIEQVNGKITAVEFTTSDVASQTALDALTLRVNTAEGTITTLGNRMTAAENNITSLGGRMTTAEGNITSLTGRVSTNEEDIAQLQAAYEALTQSEPVIIKPTDTWPVAVADRSATVIYRVVDRVNTPPQYYSDYMFRASDLSGQPVLMGQYDNAIDDEPTPSSNNLVKSGGVLNSIIQNGPAFDLSAYNAVGGVLATYADLSAALTALNALDSVYKQPGMSFKFVQTDDNKYVQYRLMLSEFTDSQFATVANWQGVDDEPTADSDNLVKSGGVEKTMIYHSQEYTPSQKEIARDNLGLDYIHNIANNNEDSVVISTDENEEIVKVDEEGIHSKDYLYTENNEEKSLILEQNSLKEKVKNIEGSEASSGDEFIKITDENEEIVKVDEDGIHAKEVYYGQTNTKLSKKIEDIEQRIDDIVSTDVVLIMFMGQSNMAGRGVVSAAHPEDAPIVIQGAGYEFRAYSDPTKLYPITKTFGNTEDNPNGINDNGRKTGGLVPAFVNSLYKKSHITTIGVSASRGGSAITAWQPNTSYLNDAISRFHAAETWLSSNGYTIKAKYVLWCQGEADGDNGMSASDYKSYFNAFANAMFAEGIEKIFVVRIGKYNGNDPEISYDAIILSQNELCQGNENYIMATTVLASLKDRGLMKDSFHYYQEGYNLAGTYAGCHVGSFYTFRKSDVMYDVMTGELYFDNKTY